MKIIIQTLKITILALFFVVAIHFSYGAFFNEDVKTGSTTMSEVQNFAETGNNNKYKFKQSDTVILANVGVALTTNVGIKFKQRAVNSLYGYVPGVAQAVSAQEVSDATSSAKHMQQISEYYNVMKTDIKSLLNNSYKKRETLEVFIDQLSYRYKLASSSIVQLTKKRTELGALMEESDQKIIKIKAKIESDFKRFDGSETNKHIEWLLRARAEYNYARTHIIFINQYIKQYEYLNNYNKTVLDALINNKDAISKSSYVVIPDTGTDILKKLNLVIPESDFKGE